MAPISALLNNGKTYLTQCFNAISTKGGTVPAKKTAMTLVSAIYTIYPNNLTGAPTAAPVSPTITETLASWKTHLKECYDAVEAKGGTIPPKKTWANLADAILSIQPPKLATITYTNNQTEDITDSTMLGKLLRNTSSNRYPYAYEDNEGIPRVKKVEFYPAAGYVSVSNPQYFLEEFTYLESVVGFEYLTQITSVGASFITHCENFNSPITLPPNVTTLGRFFMSGNSSFNSTVTLPAGLKTIGSYFMSLNPIFTKSVTIPASVNSIGEAFMKNCYKFTGTLTLNTTTLPSVADTISPDPINLSLSTTSSSDPMYTSGVKLEGAGASLWKNYLPNGVLTSNSTIAYRKLV